MTKIMRYTIPPTTEALTALVGEEIGISPWLAVTQDTIDTFADATGDHQWVHVDPVRADLPLRTVVLIGDGDVPHDVKYEDLLAAAKPVVPDEPDRSIGAEETFEADVDDHAMIHRELLRLAEKTAARLRTAGRLGSVATTCPGSWWPS